MINNKDGAVTIDWLHIGSAITKRASDHLTQADDYEENASLLSRDDSIYAAATNSEGKKIIKNKFVVIHGLTGVWNLIISLITVDLVSV